MYRAIAHPTRRRVLEMLRQGDRSAGDLLEARGHSRPTLSEHLRILHTMGLVSSRRRGPSMIYRLNRSALAAAAGWISQFQRGG